jgi:hypothetical protein
VTATTTPVAATAEQEQHQNNNQDQFHGISPLMASACLPRTEAFNGALKVLFPDARAIADSLCRG